MQLGVNCASERLCVVRNHRDTAKILARRDVSVRDKVDLVGGDPKV